MLKCRKFDISSLRYIDRAEAAFVIYTFALLLMLLSSIKVFYLWPIELFCPIITVPLFLSAIIISKPSSRNFFNRSNYLLPSLLYLCICYGQSLVNAQNVVPYILATCSVFTLYATLRIDRDMMFRVMTCICKILGGFLILSMLAFLLYLLGFNLPGNSVVNNNYSYTNHILFLLDDREVWSIIPRFHSVFLEPGHMGSSIVMLLATQIGHWKKWYNVAMIVALVMSFSLAAYGLFIILLFLRLWLYRKKILFKVLTLVLLISATVGGSFIYNDGDNMLNQLIVMRLEMNDTGDDIEGNNRVSDDFKKEFESFISSSDIFFGRDYDTSQWGNSGYRVYIYDFGALVLLLTIALYVSFYRDGVDRRAIITSAILALVNFIIRGYPIMFMFLIPYYVISQLDMRIKKEKQIQDDI